MTADGDVQVKGPQFMQGYYNNPEKTAEEIVDGWFKTGEKTSMRNTSISLMPCIKTVDI